jgi:putative molybdopterin biosynthesis protein
VAVKNKLNQARKEARLTQDELAQAVMISRQAYAAIESGRSVPSTEVALRIARTLKASVEELFRLDDALPDVVEADPMGDPASIPGGTRVQLVQVGTRLFARPLNVQSFGTRLLVPADGTVIGAIGSGNNVRLRVMPLPRGDMPELALSGCDPSVSVVAAMARDRGVRMVLAEASSISSLHALARGEVHIAGCHYRDKVTGVYNAPLVNSIVPFPCTLVRFAVWQEGLIIAAGNPKVIRHIDDLARTDVTFINRQEGSGARGLLHRLLKQANVIPSDVSGYDRCVNGHMEVASQVRVGSADCGIGVKVAACTHGLDFLLLDEEPYDLVIPDHFLELPAVRSLLDLLRTPELRRQVEALGGYDTTGMGLMCA